MKQKELTSKVVLTIIGLISVSAILVPTYATTTTSSNNTSTFSKIVNGQIPSVGNIRGLISEAITDAMQLKW